jgi:group I intron endonuclease
MWTNLVSGKTYVGSSVNLSRRFNTYYSYTHIVDFHRNLLISRALSKYGYSNFKLEILEYCEPDKVFSREQYYLDLLNP